MVNNFHCPVSTLPKVVVDHYKRYPSRTTTKQQKSRVPKTLWLLRPMCEEAMDTETYSVFIYISILYWVLRVCSFFVPFNSGIEGGYSIVYSNVPPCFHLFRQVERPVILYAVYYLTFPFPVFLLLDYHPYWGFAICIGIIWQTHAPSLTINIVQTYAQGINQSWDYRYIS